MSEGRGITTLNDERGMLNDDLQSPASSLQSKKMRKAADKPGSVVDDHYSGTPLARSLERPTREL